MRHEIPSSAIQASLDASERFNEQLRGREEEVVAIAQDIVQGTSVPLMLSHQGLVVTPREWSPSTQQTLATIANTARSGLLRVTDYLTTSDDALASGIRRNMLGGPHFAALEQAVKDESRLGVTSRLYEVGRADIINGGAVEVNAACLDAPADFHDLTTFYKQLASEMNKNGITHGFSPRPEASIVYSVVQTMVDQAQRNGYEGKPILAWVGTAKEIFGPKDKGGYWPREQRFKKIAEEYLEQIGFDAEVRLVTVEDLHDEHLVNNITSAYRNLLPEDINEQSPESVTGLVELARTGRLVGSLTSEILTNKATMAVIGSPELAQKAGIGFAEWQTLVSAFPPTAFLSSEYIYIDGTPHDLQRLLQHERNKFYFKLSNGEEGHGVFPGKSLSDSALKAFLEEAQADPYHMIVQRELAHLPFQAAAIDLSQGSLHVMDGVSDAGTHYAVRGGVLVPGVETNIVMTRFTPANGGAISNAGKDGVFRPVITEVHE